MERVTINCAEVVIKTVVAGIFIMLSTGSRVESAPAVQSFLELRQQNVVLQKYDLSCGAAALTTLLNHQHGLDLKERDVALELIGRSDYIENPELLKIKEGFSLLDLKLFVERRGFRGDGFGGLTINDLIDKAPVLIPISLDGYNHFVIFRALAENRVLIADPAWGNRTLMLDQFMDSWIDFDDLGHVGFVVAREENSNNITQTNKLAAAESDFLMLQ